MKTLPWAVSLCLSLGLVACNSKAPPPPPAAAVPPLDTSHAKKLSTHVPEGQTFKGLVMSNSLPYDIQLGKHGSLDIEDEGKANIIKNGEATLSLDARAGGLERSLRIRQFAPDSDTALVQVDVGQGSDTSVVGATPADGMAPVLVDSLSNKNTYFPVGYFYEDETKLIIRFTPGNVIQRFSDLPALSRSRPAQKLTLLYRVNQGRSVRYFALDNAAVIEYDPPLPVKQTR
jgi:hypothetical protein